MRSPQEIARSPDLLVTMGGEDGGAFKVRYGRQWLKVIASWGRGWDHVSVSLDHRSPTWAEMEHVKRLFFRPDEVAMQLHVAESDHINLHPNCLHLWRSQNESIPLPPKELV